MCFQQFLIIIIVHTANNLDEGGIDINREHNNVEAAEVGDNISIITVSDDESSAVITGNDVFLGTANEQSSENNESGINENNGGQSSENDHGYVSDSDNENAPDPIINRARNAAVIAANIIQQIIENENNIDADDIDSDASTEPFDYEEYTYRAPRRLVVAYSDSDSDSDDSYFEKYDKSNELLPAEHAICAPCQDPLINKQPYMIIPCRHFICVKCVKTIFKMDQHYWICPNCRRALESKSQVERVYL